ncbi:hypothetical protein SteCoe_16204 [Stentor coeruleus]|uniref:EF-hand domain-containing protein n=1 Tax=Stentor coeruleus TaxID=5963 RepID=A0A1R2C1Y5_9CILI|nr:hypothetical protein SteCoe_16204 [Stentor coeruleus]
MLSSDLQLKLFKLFQAIAESELDLESLRQILIEQEGFSAEKAFKSLDYMDKNFITSDDFYKYMMPDEVFTPMSSYLLLKEWDLENKGKLYYKDLIKFILPSNSSSPIKNPGSFTKSTQILKKLLKTELINIIQSEKLKHKLFNTKTFTTSTCFNFIDKDSIGYLTIGNIEKFLKKHGICETAYVEALLRRLDRDGDGKISYTEFINIVTPASKVYGNEENFKSIFTTSSPKTIKKRNNKSKNAKKNKKTGIPESGVGKFARFLMQQILLEKEIEEKRKSLALRLDFTIGKLFALIDKHNNKNISIKDLEESLNDLGIIPELNQCYLLFRQYDRDNDNFLSYWDFFDIFTPKTTEYSELLINRSVSNDYLNLFSIETLDMIVDMFIVLLNIQSVTEELKQKLYVKSFNVQRIFENIDMNDLGFLTKGCFRNLLRKYKYYPAERELEGVLVIYDANKDGKITYSKFVQGLCPKSINNL